MALETLKDVKEIGGFKIVDRDCDDSCKNEDGSFDWDKFDELRKDYPIHITHSTNMISFKIQNGPIKEVGVNGCQLDQLVETAILILKGLNEKFPCRENSLSITNYEQGLMWSEKRKKDREKRGTEGFGKA